MAFMTLRIHTGFFCGGLLLFALILPGCQQEEVAGTHRERGPSPVKVAQVTVMEIQQSVTVIGTAEPRRRSLVASEIEGLVEVYPHNEGEFVREGQGLARLRTITIDIRMKEALAIRREGLARYRKAKFQLNRTGTLLRSGTASRQQFEDDEAEERALRERLLQLESQIREYQDQLRMSKIVAPFDGWIVEEHTEVGQWVNEGGPVVEMLDLAHVQVEVPLPERYVNMIQLGGPVSVVFDALPEVLYTGTVFSIVAQANPDTRTFPVKIDIPNPNTHIKSGMFARITFPAGRPYEAMLVPKDAVVLRGGREFVIAVEDGKSKQISVQSGEHVDGSVEVIGDLNDGMDVVIEGNERLYTKTHVTILE